MPTPSGFARPSLHTLPLTHVAGLKRPHVREQTLCPKRLHPAFRTGQGGGVNTEPAVGSGPNKETVPPDGAGVAAGPVTRPTRAFVNKVLLGLGHAHSLTSVPAALMGE